MVKKKYGLILGIVLLLVIVISLLLVLLFIKKNSNKQIVNIERLYFSYTTGYHYNASISYELVCENKCTLYFKDDGESEDNRKSFSIDKNTVKEIEDKLSELNAISWDGFNKYDHGVLDGNSFTFIVNYANGESISAQGYESYPKNYWELQKYLNSVFSKYISN